MKTSDDLAGDFLQFTMASEDEKDEGSEGLVHFWQGYKNAVPRSFQIFHGVPIETVAIGHQHCGFLTRQHQLYMYGSNQHGQLGDGTFVDCLNEPLLLQSLQDQYIVSVACGSRHTVAALSDGSVYCWGDSTTGQCGTGQLGKYPSPQPVSIVEATAACCHGVPCDEAKVVIFQVAASDTHTMALSEFGEIWTWGTGMQLGLNTAEQILAPMKIEFLEGRRVLSISSGAQHCLAIIQRLKKKHSEAYRTASVGSADSSKSESKSRSQSPVVNNVQMHRYRPSTCAKCKEEIYTYTETNDACVINIQHKCPLGLSIAKKDTGNGAGKIATETAGKIGSVSEGNETDIMENDGKEKGSLEKEEKTEKDNLLQHRQIKKEQRQSLSVDICESGESLPVVSRSMPRSESAMARLEQSPQPPRKEVQLRRNQHSESDVKRMELQDASDKSSGMATDAPSDAQSDAPSDTEREKGETESAEHEKGNKDGALNATSEDNEGRVAETNLDDVAEGKELTRSLIGSHHSVGKTENSSIQKSRSTCTFFDETEAKEFLEKQLYGDDELGDVFDGASSSIPMSPLVKEVKNILQYVPSSPAQVQEYVTSLTKNVVSNLRTSLDKFAFVTGQSLDLDSISKSSSQDSLGPPGQGSRTPGEGSPRSHRRGEDDGKGSLYGSMTRSTSLGSFLRSSANSERKGSLPTVLTRKVANVGGVRRDLEAVWDTEVWSWGKGHKGQLGHGDLLDRPMPCAVKIFEDKKVIKVAAGPYHNLALTTNAQVFSWGLNSDGQLGHSDSTTTTPQRIKTMAGTPLWDIAAGQFHSVVVSDGVGFTPDVYYTGREPASEEQGGQPEMAATLTRLSAIRKAGWIKQVAAGGDLCCCITDRNTTGYIATLHEFAGSERLYFAKLDNIANAVIKPLLNLDVFKSMETTLFGPVLKMLIDSYFHVLDNVACNAVELMWVIQGQREVDSIKMVAHWEEYVAVFQHYSKCFGDVLALGGFEFATKSAAQFFEKLKEHFGDLMDASKIDKSNVAVTFRRLMQVPLHRLKDYGKIINKLAMRYPTFTGEHYAINQVSQAWDALKTLASTEHNVADNTRKFWEACPPKFALKEGLRTPGRRMLRESKTNPLSLPSSGRFSMHWLILFNDVFVHGQYSMHQTFPLPTIWVESVHDTDNLKNAITLTMPEETLTLTAPTASEKAEWLWTINQATDKILTDQKNLVRPQVVSGRLTPPLARYAAHVFYKHQTLKDARYTGMWLAGKLHGQGELVWPDGRKYVGKFKQGQQHGHGLQTAPKDGGEEIYDGQWKEGKMNGLGTYKYASGDVYEGYFRDGRKNGHGVLKTGKLTTSGGTCGASLASVYIGEWVNDKKTGFGVLDEVSKGQKYMGMWQDDNRHGNGIIVTLDGMYFEGNFVQNKMVGFGLLMTDDNSCYEGDFSGGPNLHGKGKLTLPNGDYIEGHFSGSFTEGIKVNGTFYKATEPAHEVRTFTHALGIIPKTFGTLSVAAGKKWEEIYRHCYSLLGCEEDAIGDTTKAWECVAVMINNSKKAMKDSAKGSASRQGQLAMLDELEMIPPTTRGHLYLEDYVKIKPYLAKAFDTAFHPLGKLMEGLVDVYRATYMGVGAHPRLLYHAKEEVKSYVTRIYPLVRLLFPDLPTGPELVQVYPEVETLRRQQKQEDNDDDDSSSSEMDDWDDNCEIVTAGELLHPLLLPKIYPPLFTLYALYNEKEDEKYWKRVLQWNKQGDMALMASLGMDHKFWLLDETLHETRQRLSKIKDQCYKDSIETLQHISTSFSPAEKLNLIQKTFDEINKSVQKAVGEDYLWSMDDLFPVFLFVVVRARIRHLGAEIHFIDDLMESHLQHGELGIMFTTLKACYYQIQNEKVT